MRRSCESLSLAAEPSIRTDWPSVVRAKFSTLTVLSEISTRAGAMVHSASPKVILLVLMAMSALRLPSWPRPISVDMLSRPPIGFSRSICQSSLLSMRLSEAVIPAFTVITPFWVG